MISYNVLVTGGAGFIGSNLCDYLLENNHNVINVDNFNNYYSIEIKRKNVKENLNHPNYKIVEIDITNYDDLERVFENNEIDIVIHLAALAGVRPSINNPLLYSEVNVIGSQYILELCNKYKIRKFICASSSSVYGNNKKVPFKESDNVDFPISPYAATKKTCEVISHVYHHLYKIDVALLRFFTVYGPRQRPDLAIHKFTDMISKGESIPFYGDGNTMRDYTYIDDIIDGIIKSMNYVMNNEDVYEIFNLGESQTISLNELVNSIEEGLGIKAKRNILPMQMGDVHKTYADISKAKELINYNPQTSFQEGIKKFIHWYKENRNS